jgi:hypothetical protein
MNVISRLLIIVLVSLLARAAVAAPPVVRGRSVPSTADYQAAAASAGIAWGDDADNETVQHVLLRLEKDRVTLTVGLPSRVPLAAAETWLQDLVDRMGWSDVRLYSYQNASQLRVRAQARKQASAVSPFRRLTSLDVALLRARLRTLTPGPVLLGVRTIDAEVVTAEPSPAVRVVRNGETFLFYPVWPSASPSLNVTYGLNTRQMMALAVSAVLWLLFPIVVLWAYRAHLMQQTEVTVEGRQRIYASWLHGVRIAGLIGAFLTFAVLGYSRVVPRFVNFGLTPLFALGWWYGAMGKLIGLPEPDGEGAPIKPFDRWFSAAGDLGLAGLFAAFSLAPYFASSQIIRQILDYLPLIVGVGGALMWLASVLLLRGIQRGRGTARFAMPPAAAILNNPAAVRELLQRLTAEIEAEEPHSTPTFPNAVPPSVVHYVLAMDAAMRELDVDQQAALQASGELVESGEPVRKPALTMILWSCAPLGFMGLAAGFLPLRDRWPVVLGGAGLSFVLMLLGGHLSTRSLNTLHRQILDADLRVATAMDDPSRLLDALRQLAECERLHGAKPATGVSTTSIYEERRQRLAGRLGLD